MAVSGRDRRLAGLRARLGRNLSRGQKALNWWLGDWWAVGSHRYGQRAAVAAQGLFGVEFQSLMNMATVCRAFETSRRREVLSFTHHAEVASLPSAQADKLLDQAERENWSTRDLRAAALVVKPHVALLCRLHGGLRVSSMI